MKKILLLLTLAPSLVFGQSYEVLFLGNSYTYYNNMPQQVADLASSFGDTVIYDSNTPGGATFNGHSTNATTLAKIRQQEWDYVVLQAQSQEPSFSPWQVANDVYPYAQILVDSIAQNSLCTEPLFFMTWGRKYGDQQNCAAYPPICTYQGMQNRLRQSYLEMASTHNASASPVGISWQNAMAQDSTIDLYSTDNSHPSIYGSYLAACTFYSSLFKKSCVGSSFWPSGIDSATAEFLQSVASSTVLDSLAVWEIFNADFTHSANGNSVAFANASSNYESLAWDFGDGNQSTDPNPTHTYAASGSYTVTLTTQNNSNCWVDTVSKVITVVAVPMTYVPDDNFEQALIDLGYDTGAPDDSVPTANIDTISFLYISGNNISDLTGIEDFTALAELSCSFNLLDTIDVSQNTSLVYLDCSYNMLAYLDVSENIGLTYLSCSQNQLTTLDISNNTVLSILTCRGNQLTGIDLSNNLVLEEFYCSSNLLSSLDLSNNQMLTNISCGDNLLVGLDVSNNTSLIELSCINNDLTSLDLSQNLALNVLYCMDNQLSSLSLPQGGVVYCSRNQLTILDLSNSPFLTELYCTDNVLTQIDVSGATSLTILDAKDNQLSRLDVSSATALNYFVCSGNQLGCLNMKNGNNNNFVAFSAINNPNLDCIEVDDEAWAAANWTYVGGEIDGTTSFSDDCNYPTSCDGGTNGMPPIDCSLLELADVTIDDSSMTIDITIYNGDTNQINYPYIGLVVDAMGDTIQNGFSWIFVQFAGDSVIYSNTLNSVSPVYPLTVYFAYSDLMGGMGTDTCVLSYAAPVGISETFTKNKELLYITDILGRTTLPLPNRVLFYIYDDGSVEKKIQLEK